MAGMLRVVDGLTISDTRRYLDYRGEDIRLVIIAATRRSRRVRASPVLPRRPLSDVLAASQHRESRQHGPGAARAGKSCLQAQSPRKDRGDDQRRDVFSSIRAAIFSRNSRASAASSETSGFVQQQADRASRQARGRAPRVAQGPATVSPENAWRVLGEGPSSDSSAAISCLMRLRGGDAVIVGVRCARAGGAAPETPCRTPMRRQRDVTHIILI